MALGEDRMTWLGSMVRVMVQVLTFSRTILLVSSFFGWLQYGDTMGSQCYPDNKKDSDTVHTG